MPPAQDSVETGQQHASYRDTTGGSKDASQNAPQGESNSMQPPPQSDARSIKDHHRRKYEEEKRETKNRSRRSHENPAQEDKPQASGHLPAPAVPPLPPKAANPDKIDRKGARVADHPQSSTTSTYVASNRPTHTDSSHRPAPSAESQRSETPSSDEDFSLVKRDSTRPNTRSRSKSLTSRTPAMSSTSQASGKHHSSDTSSARGSYASAVTSHDSHAIAPGSQHTQYTSPSAGNPHPTETPAYSQHATMDRRLPEQEFENYIPSDTFQEVPHHSDPGESKAKSDADSTRRDKRRSQQGDPPRSTSAPSGGYITAGFRSLFSGSVAPILEEEMNRMKEKLRQADKEIDNYRLNLNAHQYELQRSQREVRDYGRKCHELQHNRQKLMETNASLVHELNAVNRRFEETKALSDTRGKELIGAQAFLTKADSLSISDVVQKVEGLNEEIFQAAASLGECIIRRKYDLTEVQLGECFQQAASLIGQPLAGIVVEESRKPEEEPANPLLVQVVLQVFLAYFCVAKILAWTPDNDAINSFLKQTYEDIRDSEEQAVSGRWRALTRKNLFTNSELWMPDLADKLSTVFQLCGWNTTQSHREAFENQLIPIFKGVHDARTALGEMFTSADLEASTIQPGVPFKREYMEEVYGDGDDHKSGTQAVVATTGIGVRKALPRERRYENVMSPKVILESSLKVALEPQPQEASRRSKGRRDKRPRDEQQDDRQRSKVPAFSHEK